MTEHGLAIYFRNVKSQTVVLGQLRRAVFIPELPTGLAYVAVLLSLCRSCFTPFLSRALIPNKHLAKQTPS